VESMQPVEERGAVESPLVRPSVKLFVPQRGTNDRFIAESDRERERERETEDLSWLCNAVVQVIKLEIETVSFNICRHDVTARGGMGGGQERGQEGEGL